MTNLKLNDLNKLSLTSVLEVLGHRPERIGSKPPLYRNVLLADQPKPTFSLNEALGVWFDEGIRKGGSTADFLSMYWPGLSPRQQLDKVQQLIAKNGRPSRRATRPRMPQKIPHFIVCETKDLGTNSQIIAYLEEKRVFEQARSCMQEICYYMEDHTGRRKYFCSAGWPNETGGFQVDCPAFRGCIGRHGITHIPGAAKHVTLFENCFDYLSALKNGLAGPAAILLNATGLLKAGIAAAKAYSHIDLYFAGNNTGRNMTREFIRALPYASDRSAVFNGFKDYHEMILAEDQ